MSATADGHAIEVHALRAQIDALDDQLVDLLAQRFVLTRRIGATKRLSGLDPVDVERERVLYERICGRARRRAIDPELVQSLYERILARVVGEHISGVFEGVASLPAIPSREHFRGSAFRVRRGF